MSITPQLIEQIASAIRRPCGTVSFKYSSDQAFQANARAAILLDIPADGHFFRLDRTSDRVLRFFHSSPGTGTRVASISLAGLPDFARAHLFFTWTPEETRFYCGPLDPRGELLSATGQVSQIEFRVGRDGTVIQLGSQGVQVMGLRVRQAGEPILVPTAKDVWESTTRAIEVLWTGKSDQGFLFQVVLTSATLSMLVTGLENYASTRLLEVEREGIALDWNALFQSFTSKAERESNLLVEFQDTAAASGKSILETIIRSRRINFQSYDHLKRAFRSAYGIKLGEIGLTTQTLSELQEFIQYRHRVIHVSPLLGMLNEHAVPPEQPVFSNRNTADRAVACFSAVVAALHTATLALRPNE